VYGAPFGSDEDRHNEDSVHRPVPTTGAVPELTPVTKGAMAKRLIELHNRNRLSMMISQQ
jgi:hypothetical protein